ncbi:MAG: hypothetical protein GXP14_12825 [Gammaproteobacteria bacterium]|nr:hypothetical protein [Gammaproteobacteria bacterium]
MSYQSHHCRIIEVGVSAVKRRRMMDYLTEKQRFRTLKLYCMTFVIPLGK